MSGWIFVVIERLFRRNSPKEDYAKQANGIMGFTHTCFKIHAPANLCVC